MRSFARPMEDAAYMRNLERHHRAEHLAFLEELCVERGQPEQQPQAEVTLPGSGWSKF